MIKTILRNLIVFILLLAALYIVLIYTGKAPTPQEIINPQSVFENGNVYIAAQWSSAELKNRPIMYVYMTTDSTFSKLSVSQINELQEKFKDTDLAIMALYPEKNIKTVLRFQKRHKARFSALYDASTAVDQLISKKETAPIFIVQNRKHKNIRLIKGYNEKNVEKLSKSIELALK